MAPDAAGAGGDDMSDAQLGAAVLLAFLGPWFFLVAATVGEKHPVARRTLLVLAAVNLAPLLVLLWRAVLFGGAR